MPTLKPRVMVTLDEAPHAVLKQFASDNDLTLSELVAAIVHPVAVELAYELRHHDDEQPSLFPHALLQLYADEPFIDRAEAAERLREALDALKRNRALVASLVGVGGGREDGATAPPAPANDAAHRPSTPVSNTGVTLARKSAPPPSRSPRRGSPK